MRKNNKDFWFEILYPSFRIFTDSVMINSAFVAEWDGSLSGTTFWFPDEEAAIDARAEQVFGCIAGDGSVIPRMFLQRIDGRHIVGRNPADSSRPGMSFTPFSTFVVAQYFYLLTCFKFQVT